MLDSHFKNDDVAEGPDLASFPRARGGEREEACSFLFLFFNSYHHFLFCLKSLYLPSFERIVRCLLQHISPLMLFAGKCFILSQVSQSFGVTLGWVKV